MPRGTSCTSSPVALAAAPFAVPAAAIALAAAAIALVATAIALAALGHGFEHCPVARPRLRRERLGRAWPGARVFGRVAHRRLPRKQRLAPAAGGITRRCSGGARGVAQGLAGRAARLDLGPPLEAEELA
eukprot:scaffold91492_cov72-Phaeocystis_antarctica.AAC.4